MNGGGEGFILPSKSHEKGELSFHRNLSSQLKRVGVNRVDILPLPHEGTESTLLTYSFGLFPRGRTSSRVKSVSVLSRKDRETRGRTFRYVVLPTLDFICKKRSVVIYG